MPDAPIPHRVPRASARSAVPTALARLGLLAALAFAPFGLGCRAPESGSSATAAAALPTLEDIFFLPGPQGRPPSLESLSADGRWAFVRWSPLVTKPDGSRAFEDGDASRFVRTDRAVVGEGVGESARALFALLAPTTEPAEKARVPPREWSKRGHRLALARDTELWIADAPSDATGVAHWRARRIYVDPPKEAEPDAPRLERVASLRFSDDDSELVVDNGKETYAFAIAHDLDALAERPLSEARCLTAELEQATGDVELARDRSVAFSARAAFELEASAVVPDGDSPPTAAPPRRKGQILFVREHRAVELEGFADLAEREDVSLSPDGRFVLAEKVERVDEQPRQLIPDYLSTRVSTHEARRDRAEDRFPPRELLVWSTADGKAHPLELPGGPMRMTHHLGWSKDPAHGALYVFTRTSEDWKTFEVWRWTDAGAALLFSDHDDAWYDGPSVGARWSGDGTRVIVGSEATPRSSTPGRCQLFSLDPATGVLRQLTSVRGEVDAFDVARDGSLAFLASDGDPTRRVLGFCNAAMVRGDAGASSFLVPTPTGFLSALSLAEEGTRATFRRHTLGHPAEIWSVELSEHAHAVQLSDTAPRAFVESPRILPEVFTATSRDGSRVWSHVYLPRSTSVAHPDRARPCVVFIHGAGYLQNVTDSMTEYEPNLTFHSRLAEQGYVVVDVDYRGSSGYGRRFRADVHLRLGELELQDLHAVLDELADRGVIDSARVGCYGGSYGGFLTLMALFTEPGKWRCGAALRSVTDWRSYHPSYTQPRLGRPSENEEVYERCSPIDLAEGLRDPLLILHGMQDSNVFAQDSIRLIERLIDLGKEFDAMLYPSQDHAFTDGRHWVDEYRRIERLMKQHLGEP
ncbi:MAG: S9 family peptidase [Planctomycetes bacterium]|nr:S9 family peptidase [Planctomycetota bacterium]